MRPCPGRWGRVFFAARCRMLDGSTRRCSFSGCGPARRPRCITKSAPPLFVPTNRQRAPDTNGSADSEAVRQRANLPILQAGEENECDYGPDQGEKHVGLRVPRIALRTEKLHRALPRRQGNPPLD